MTQTIAPARIRVGIDTALAPWCAEIKYVLRTLLRVAGYAYEFVWVSEAGNEQDLDIYYGPRAGQVAARVRIRACGQSFSEAPHVELNGLSECEGVSFIGGADGSDCAFSRDGAGLLFSNDIVYACYWLLTGAREPQYPADRWGNLNLAGSSFLRNSLASKPLVSLYGTLLKQHFRDAGYEPFELPWATTGAAFVLSHDVDYPQIIRWLECLRLLGRRGLRGLSSIRGVLDGTNHFWKFDDWMEFEKRLGVRPAFYFMARKGSLVQYALGTPDGFYDVRAPEFRALFRRLRDEGCEIGLHASFNAYRSAAVLRREKQLLEEAAGVRILGNRHHFWHLDPTAPNETLRRAEQAGLLYDSSLAFEFYPGFRRGICHPFRVFHSGERRELELVELPPAWMDDHFDRRLEVNQIEDAEAYARGLVETARATGGIVVVDYHPRGMNSDFYPRYGAWLTKFIADNLNRATVAYRSPGEVVAAYLEYEQTLEGHSRDLTARFAEARSQTREEEAAQIDDAPIRVELLRAGEGERWDAFIDEHPQGNIYHTLAWRDVTAEGLGHRPYYLWALDASGDCSGVLPLFLVRGLWGRRLVSVPMRDRGGLLARDGRAASLLLARAIELTRELDCKYLELRSFDRLDESVAGAHGLRCERQWITTRIDLAPGAERIWKSLNRNQLRWGINKSRREGVRVVEDDSREGVEIFYEMFVRTRRSMGIPSFPKRLFEAVWRHLIAEGRANLFIAWKDSVPIGGMINLLSKDTFIPAYAAPQKEWLKYRPSEMVIWHAIEWACRQGFAHFDFGADSPAQEGLLWFKKKWGGVQRPMNYYYFLNGAARLPNFDSSSPAYTVLRKVWAAMPTPLCKTLGSRVTRQLS